MEFTSSIKEAVKSSEVIFIAVGTPSLENGEADLTGIENVAHNITKNMATYAIKLLSNSIEASLPVKRISEPITNATIPPAVSIP
ncbi:MAG: hypothetical protein NTV42_09110 [Chloroflexi bacterium]|nr:hypothetical protein [Chloroflexota bacterium]